MRSVWNPSPASSRLHRLSVPLLGPCILSRLPDVRNAPLQAASFASGMLPPRGTTKNTLYLLALVLYDKHLSCTTSTGYRALGQKVQDNASPLLSQGSTHSSSVVTAACVCSPAKEKKGKRPLSRFCFVCVLCYNINALWLLWSARRGKDTCPVPFVPGPCTLYLSYRTSAKRPGADKPLSCPAKDRVQGNRIR